MDNFELYKELYHKENERRQEVYNNLNIPIAIITAITTVTYYLITNFDYSFENFLNIIFIILIILTFLGIVLSSFFLIKAFTNVKSRVEYTGLPYAQALYDWHKELVNHFLKYGSNQQAADEYFKKFITENLVKHVDHNMYVNDRKMKNIWLSKGIIVITLLLTFLNLFPFSYNYFNKKERIEKIEVVKNSDIIKLN
jgi:hypothetical protein